LHPLVLINISDHYTREKVRSKDSELYNAESERIAGVLFGVQKGLVVDVLESFEMKYTILDSSGMIQFDEQFLATIEKQCKFRKNL
jgi:COP9 signalosome complex subunit 6